MCIPKRLNAVSDSFVIQFYSNFHERFEDLSIEWDSYKISVFEDKTDEGPMTSNYSGKIVFFYPASVEQLNLSTDELIALFAHEIGHFVDSTGVDNYGNVKPSIEREYNADDFAQNLGLGGELLSGLQKIKAHFPIQPEDRLQRIEQHM